MNLASINDQKIVVIVTFCDYGGMLHYAQCLSGALKGQCKTALVTRGEADTRADFCISPQYTGIKQKLFEFYNPFYYRKIARKIIRKYAPDTIHITSSCMGGLPFVDELKKNGVHVVFTLHDPDPHEEKRSLWSRFVSRVHRWSEITMMKNCDVVHVHSELHKEILLQRTGLNEPEISVIQHGAGLSPLVAVGCEVPSELKAIPKQGKKPLILLFFGRIEPYKGLSLLMSALISRNYSREVMLIIAGQGEIDQVALRSLREKNIQVYVLNRFIRDCEVKGVFEASDVVVLPYISATQTGVIPLAYAFDKSVIASRAGALPELIRQGETGLLHDVGCSRQLGECIESYAVDQKLASTLGEQAATMMSQKLSWKVIANKHLLNYFPSARPIKISEAHYVI